MNSNVTEKEQGAEQVRRRRITQVDETSHPALENEHDIKRRLINMSNILNLPRKIEKEVIEELIYPLCDDVYAMNLTELQKLSLQALRTELARLGVGIVRDEKLSLEDAGEITCLMRQYCAALRDLDFMKAKHSKDVRKDPFKLVSSMWRDLTIMEDVGVFSCSSIKEVVSEKGVQVPDDFHSPSLFGDPRGSTKKNDLTKSFITRLLTGLVGGVSLIVPMLLMVLLPPQTVQLATTIQLVTTSIFTLLFSSVLAFYHGEGASPLALVGATAAYTAVLVVFIGAST